MNFIQRYQPTSNWINEIDRLFDARILHPQVFQTQREACHESENAWILRLDLPGFSKEEVSLTVTENVLKLNAETPSDRPFGGKYERQWQLGNSIDPAGISARLENGVLEISLAKKVPVAPESVSIDIQ